ncbi:MAG: hypothetical protein QNK03_15860 [Myxococcota bacterium]|nr:hypothetical protein [Myxococcota bacterium]
MDRIDEDLMALSLGRRQLAAQTLAAVAVLGALVALAPALDSARAEAHATFAIAVIGTTVAFLRFLFGAIAVLDHACPRCFSPFHGGLLRVLASLPRLPRSCRSCGLALPARLRRPSGSLRAR